MYTLANNIFIKSDTYTIQGCFAVYTLVNVLPVFHKSFTTMFSDELRRFVLRIPSIPFLEALLLLRNAPAQTWDAGMVAHDLYIKPQQATELLTSLTEAGICEEVSQSPSCFVYKPRPDELRDLIDDLAHEYAHNLIEVTNLIHANTDKDQKIRLLADAFILRKDD